MRSPRIVDEIGQVSRDVNLLRATGVAVTVAGYEGLALGAAQLFHLAPFVRDLITIPPAVLLAATGGSLIRKPVASHFTAVSQVLAQRPELSLDGDARESTGNALEQVKISLGSSGWTAAYVILFADSPSKETILRGVETRVDQVNNRGKPEWFVTPENAPRYLLGAIERPQEQGSPFDFGARAHLQMSISDQKWIDVLGALKERLEVARYYELAADAARYSDDLHQTLRRVDTPTVDELCLYFGLTCGNQVPGLDVSGRQLRREIGEIQRIRPGTMDTEFARMCALGLLQLHPSSPILMPSLPHPEGRRTSFPEFDPMQATHNDLIIRFEHCLREPSTVRDSFAGRDGVLYLLVDLGKGQMEILARRWYNPLEPTATASEDQGPVVDSLRGSSAIIGRFYGRLKPERSGPGLTLARYGDTGSWLDHRKERLQTLDAATLKCAQQYPGCTYSSRERHGRWWAEGHGALQRFISEDLPNLPRASGLYATQRALVAQTRRPGVGARALNAA